MTNQLKQLSEAATWPREIWMAELDEHHNGTGMVVLSEFATVPRWEGDDERDGQFQRYVDADIHESAERYHKARYEALEAQLTEARAREAVAYEVAAKHILATQISDPSIDEDWVKGNNSGVKGSAHAIRALAPDHTTTALEQIKQEADKAGFERALNAASAVGYCECAETRHVTLGDKVSQAIMGIEYKPATLSADTQETGI